MTESDFEIEYLDEDEDVVQQCVQASENTDSVPVALSRSKVPASKYVVQLTAPESSSGSLLVERPRVPRSYKKKRSREDEDSDYDPDYDPSEDVEPVPRRYKKRMPSSTPRSTPTIERRTKIITHTMTKQEELKFRRSMGLKIPNFEDPLCLPVKAIVKDESDLRKLRNWNNLCLNNYKNHDTSLKPDDGDTVASQRTVVLRTVKNKLTGKNETTLWGKLTVQSERDKKSEVFQGVLPKYREGKLLEFGANMIRKTKTVRSTEMVVLTKEDDKGEVLVVYKPQQALSAVYKLMEEQNEEAGEVKKEENKKLYLKELTVCKMCAPCYQGSWRGYKTTSNKKRSVICPICARSFVSVYNLLAHVKTHNASDVQAYKKLLCKTLANVVEYHYKCRICHLKCPSIKDLRKHVLAHQANEQYQCEVCNRESKLPVSTSTYL